jgi:hypothetical protein
VLGAAARPATPPHASPPPSTSTCMPWQPALLPQRFLRGIRHAAVNSTPTAIMKITVQVTCGPLEGEQHTLEVDHQASFHSMRRPVATLNCGQLATPHALRPRGVFGPSKVAAAATAAAAAAATATATTTTTAAAAATTAPCPHRCLPSVF